MAIAKNRGTRKFNGKTFFLQWGAGGRRGRSIAQAAAERLRKAGHLARVVRSKTRGGVSHNVYAAKAAGRTRRTGRRRC